MERVAVITGASQGLGLALASALAADGWSLVIDARQPDRLREAASAIEAGAADGSVVVAIAGDVADPVHRAELVDAAKALGPVDLLVNNASVLGASPLRQLTELDAETLTEVFAVNAVAPIDLIARLAETFTPNATIVNLSSDAGVEAYETWGGYGASKAALDHASRVLAAEHPEWRVLAVDPGDMRTQMHQEAFPGEDISDRPEPSDSVPGLLALIEGPWPSGRYQAKEMTP